MLSCDPLTRHTAGGWYPEESGAEMKYPPTLEGEVAQAFSNVDHVLKIAGGKGWSQVFSVRCYYLDSLDGDGLNMQVEQLRKWCVDHRPLWTVIGVRALAAPGMNIEIEVVADVSA